jgi:hypothetical protein
MLIVQSGPGYEPAYWDSFAVAEVGASAALAGLLVVAATINIERIIGIPTVIARLSGTLALFAGSLVAGVVLLVPGLHPRPAGALLATIGIVAGLIVVWPRALRHVEPSHRGTTMITTALAVTAAALVAFSGFAYSFQALGGLYWLALGIVLTFLVGLGNAWVAMIEILR